MTTDHEDDLYFQDLDEEQFVSLDCGEVHDYDGGEVNLQSAGACPGLEEIVFIVDAVSENHLINWSSIDPEDPGIHKTPKVMRLQTANGIISADKRVNIDIPSLGVTVVACAQLQAFQVELFIGCGMAVVPRLPPTVCHRRKSWR